MILLAGDSSVLLQYIVSFFNLSLPFISTLLLIVVWVHFRNKRKRKVLREKANKAGIDQKEMPEYSMPMPPLSASDRQRLIKKCREQLSGSRARYAALKYSFISLQQKEAGLYNTSITQKSKTMENFQEKIAAFEKQVTELQNKIEMLETIPPPLNNEAHFLRELLAEKEKEVIELRSTLNQSQGSGTFNTNSFSPEEQQQEIVRLKNIIEEQSHLGDMLDETRQQVGFLQNQLEQRVKANKATEQKLTNISEELSQSQFYFHEAGRKSLETEKQLHVKEDEIENLQRTISSKETDLQRVQDEIRFKGDQLLVIENSFNEIKQQNESLNASVQDNQDIITSLRDQLAGEQQKNENLQEMLRKNRQILHRFYKELDSVEGVKEEDENQKNLLVVA